MGNWNKYFLSLLILVIIVSCSGCTRNNPNISQAEAQRIAEELIRREDPAGTLSLSYNGLVTRKSENDGEEDIQIYVFDVIGPTSARGRGRVGQISINAEDGSVIGNNIQFSSRPNNDKRDIEYVYEYEYVYEPVYVDEPVNEQHTDGGGGRTVRHVTGRV